MIKKNEGKKETGLMMLKGFEKGPLKKKKKFPQTFQIWKRGEKV